MRSESIEAKSLMSNIEALHSKLQQRQVDETRAQQLSQSWIGKASIEEQEKKFKTSYHAVVKSTNALTVKW